MTQKTCPDCNGEGVIEKETDDERRCPTCGGSGFVPDDNDDNEEVIRTGWMGTVRGATKAMGFSPKACYLNCAATLATIGWSRMTDSVSELGRQLNELKGALDLLFELREEFAQWVEEAQDGSKREALENEAISKH
jgi:hypothetical protein